MELTTNPDYETLKLIVAIAGAVITILLTVVGYFLNRQTNRQIKVQENMTDAVTELTSSVNTMTTLDKERYPTTVKRLNSHRDSIKNHETRLTKIETRCNMKHHLGEGG